MVYIVRNAIVGVSYQERFKPCSATEFSLNTETMLVARIANMPFNRVHSKSTDQIVQIHWLVCAFILLTWSKIRFSFLTNKVLLHFFSLFTSVF